MPTANLFNFLELAYTPISNYDFSMVKHDNVIKNYVNSGKLYMIVQRPVLTFENLMMDQSDHSNPIFKFEIHQRNSKDVAHVRLPIFQKNFQLDRTTSINLAITHAHPKPTGIKNEYPFNGLANFIIIFGNGEKIWFSPEKFIYHLWRKSFHAEVTGSLEAFTKYQVHYIGKATEQEMVERLTGHSNLQDILSREYPFHYGSLPTHEIAILFFKFFDNIHLDTFGFKEKLSPGTIDILSGKSPLDRTTIYLDAEKAFINALKPNYNRQLYKNYPHSKDGLEQYNLNTYTYSITDPITLIYSDGEIKGNSTLFKGNTITIANGILKIQ